MTRRNCISSTPRVEEIILSQNFDGSVVIGRNIFEGMLSFGGEEIPFRKEDTFRVSVPLLGALYGARTPRGIFLFSGYHAGEKVFKIF